MVSGWRVQPGHWMGRGQTGAFLGSSEGTHTASRVMYIEHRGTPAYQVSLDLGSW